MPLTPLQSRFLPLALCWPPAAGVLLPPTCPQRSPSGIWPARRLLSSQSAREVGVQKACPAVGLGVCWNKVPREAFPARRLRTAFLASLRGQTLVLSFLSLVTIEFHSFIHIFVLVTRILGP